jgi:hypothetical protein
VVLDFVFVLVFVLDLDLDFDQEPAGSRLRTAHKLLKLAA